MHQQPAVFPALTIAENLALGAGFPTGPGGRIRWSVLHKRTAELLAEYHIPASPRTPLGALRAVDRSRVAIIRALQDRDEAGHGVLVLDEPTAALPGPEVEQLLDALRAYAAAGQTIMYVSHRLDEALSVADRVTVLRDGRKVATVSTAGLTESALIELIVGRPIDRLFPEVSQDAHDEGALSLRGVHGGPLHGVDLSVRKGEVLGIAGLLGSGRSELLRMIFGAYPMLAGSLAIDGQPYRPASPSAAMDAGIAYVPEDRQADALFHAASVRHNLSAGQDGRYFRQLLFRHGAERRDSAAVDQRVPDPGPVGPAAGADPVRRQPAEGGAGPVAPPAAPAAAAGRAHPGRGRRRAQRDLPAGPAGHRGRQQRAAGGQRDGGARARLRPGRGAQGRPDRRCRRAASRRPSAD